MELKHCFVRRLVYEGVKFRTELAVNFGTWEFTGEWEERMNYDT